MGDCFTQLVDITMPAPGKTASWWGRCKLDPGLKAPGFKSSTYEVKDLLST